MATGGIDTESIKTAGQLGALGLDPMRFLETTDGLERAIMLLVAQEVVNVRTKLDHSLAVDIANQVGKLFKR